MTAFTDNPFRHVNLTLLQPRPDLTVERAAGTTDALCNAKDLAESAISIMRGVFPRESPYFSWETVEYLPWYGEFEGRPETLSDAICTIAKLLLGGKTLAERGPVLFEVFEHEPRQNEHVIQYIAVEMLLAIEGLFDSIYSGSFVAALAWQHAAFAHLCEATVAAIELLERSPPSYTVH